jgi:hypothetical protein
MNEKTNGQQRLAPVSLLDARRAAIEKAVEECGGEKNKDGSEDSIRGMLVILARESAGFGFDEGIRYMASNVES